MRTFFMLALILLAVAATIVALTAFSTAASAIQEIEGLIAAVMLTICAAAGYIAAVIRGERTPAKPPKADGK